jgi:hypothetical protein
MKRFKGDEITLNIGTVKRVRDVLGVDLTQPEKGDPPLVARLIDDDLFFVEVLEELCPGLEIENLESDDVLEAMTLFMEEWTNFFTLRGRTDRVGIIKHSQKILKEVIRTVETAISGETSTDSPESPESTPTS